MHVSHIRTTEQKDYFGPRSVIHTVNCSRALKIKYQTHTHTHTCLAALCLGLPERAGTRKVTPIWILLKQETVSGSGISWAICKSAPRSRQITMPAPHHSVFYRPDALPAAQPTGRITSKLLLPYIHVHPRLDNVLLFGS